MSPFLANFSLLLFGLKKQIAVVAHQARAHAAVLSFAYFHLNRLEQRFKALYTHWKNGTLPKPCPPRPGREQTTPRKPTTRYPSRPGWLGLQHGYMIRGYASQFRHWLANTPELLEFLEAAPQARRILGPICQMLGATLPPRAAPKPEPPATPVACNAPCIAPPSVPAAPPTPPAARKAPPSKPPKFLKTA
jgi:hypothetical protein